MKYYLIAGEASGDINAAALMSSILKQDPDAEFRYWGGDEMGKIAPGLVKHYKNTSFMGFVEVFKNLKTIISLFKFCKKDILNYNPDKVIFIDYPGFNLRMAKWTKRKGFFNIYFIAPQVWAWKESRVKQINAYVDQLFVVLPFEKAFFAKHNIDAHYFGHPLKHRINKFIKDKSTNTKNKNGFIACFPGSRKQEIKSHMHIINAIAKKMPQQEFKVAAVKSVQSKIYEQKKEPNIKLVYNQNYELLCRAKSAIISSGTATLEAALFGVPQVVIYKGNPISYQIAKRIINLKYISLVNLLADSPVVSELIQSELTVDRLHEELSKLNQNDHRASMFNSYSSISSQLGEGNPCNKIAELILSV